MSDENQRLKAEVSRLTDLLEMRAVTIENLAQENARLVEQQRLAVWTNLAKRQQARWGCDAPGEDWPKGVWVALDRSLVLILILRTFRPLILYFYETGEG